MSLETDSCSRDEFRNGEFKSELEHEIEVEVELQNQVRPVTGHTVIERVIAISDIHGCSTALGRLSRLSIFSPKIPS
jgi:hypothetical protein